jgi:hypothetical protein
MSSDENNLVSQDSLSSLSTSITDLTGPDRDQQRQHIETAVNVWTPGTEMAIDIDMIFFDLAKAGEGVFLLKLLDLLLAKKLDKIELANFLSKLERVSDVLLEKGDGHNSVMLLLRLIQHSKGDVEVIRTVIARLDEMGWDEEAEEMNSTLADLYPDAKAYQRRARYYWKNKDKRSAFLDIQRSLVLDPSDDETLFLYHQIEPERMQRAWMGASARKIEGFRPFISHRRLHIAGFHNSGVSWLTTVLFQLGYYVTRRDWGHWANPKTGEICLPQDHSMAHHRRKFSGLNKHLSRGAFEGKHHISFEGSHCWPSAQYANLDTVLVYRNLMSTLLSLYKRRVVTGTTAGFSLREYFDQCVDLRTGLGLPDKWAIYYLLWINLYAGENLLLLSFDEGRRNPASEVGAVLSLLGEKYEDRDIISAAGRSYLGDIAHDDQELTLLQTGRGSTDDYLNLFSYEDEQWITGLPLQMWDYFEGKWDGNISDMSFKELIDGLAVFGGQMTPDLAYLCDSGNITTAYNRAAALSDGQNRNSVFVFAVDKATKLIDNPLQDELNAILDENFIRALKVYLYAFQNLMAPHLMLSSIQKLKNGDD